MVINLLAPGIEHVLRIFIRSNECNLIPQAGGQMSLPIRRPVLIIINTVVFILDISTSKYRSPNICVQMLVVLIAVFFWTLLLNPDLSTIRLTNSRAQ